MSEYNKPSDYPSINLTKSISKAQGLVRYILENQKDKLLQAGDVTALDAIRDTLRTLNMAHNDLDELLQEHREEKDQIVDRLTSYWKNSHIN